MKDSTLPPAQNPGDDEAVAQALAGHTLVMAARSLAELNRPFENEATRSQTMARLLESLQVEGDGAAHMSLQLLTLDALFHRCIMKATDRYNVFGGGRRKATDNFLHTEYAQIALKTQRQCRQTMEALARRNKKRENKLNDPQK